MKGVPIVTPTGRVINLGGASAPASESKHECGDASAALRLKGAKIKVAWRLQGHKTKPAIRIHRFK